MTNTNQNAIRNLIPKGYSFDAFNEFNSSNPRDKPFFCSEDIMLGNYYLSKHLDDNDNLILQFSNICPNKKFLFKPYVLSFKKYIDLLHKALDEKSDFITFEIGIDYYSNCEDSCCISRNEACSYFKKYKPASSIAAVSFEINAIKDALSVYFGIKKESKGDNIMKTLTKLLGKNFEIGLNKDPNIASTLMGVAVRNEIGGNWYVFDQSTQTLKNYAGMKMGDFKVFLLPTNVLNIGDLTKMDGKYYYVQKIEGNYITLLSAGDGLIVQKLLSDCIIPGMNFYTKVVALDPRTLCDPNSQNNMSSSVIAAICMMNWSKGSSEFSLDDIEEDSFNGLGTLLMLSGNNNMFSGENGFSLPMLIAMGGGNSSEEANSMVQYMLLNQILNPNSANNTGLPLLNSSPTASAEVTDNGVYCAKCNISYPAGTNFCTKCGSHTEIKGKKCIDCGNVLPENAVFCPNCGKKVSLGNCPNCGKKVQEGANFCAACGFDLNAKPLSAASKESANSEETVTKPSKSPENEE